MPELPPTTVLAQLRRMALLALGALSLHALPACARAQTVPAGLRACTAQTDPARRLACYDREMALLMTPRAHPGAAPAAAAPDLHASPAPPPQAGVPTSATPAVANHETSAPPPAPAHHWTAPWKVFAGGASSAVTAHVVSLDRSPDSLVLHLDNGQAWQQIGRASGDLSLRAGDEVTIEKHLGSYWLSSRYVSSMRVRLKP
ncbi:MAG: hypothetical protein WBW93_09660 [Steroidobacteraceae bacterium]